jgi:predicted nucleic acid-binding protein
MSRVVLLDAGPLGMVSNPRSNPEAEECKTWLASLLQSGLEVVIPEIADYEVRRELLRAKRDKGLARLNALKAMLEYAPITTAAMLKAAEFWAVARNSGRPSADDSALDADVILAAQAAVMAQGETQPVIATTNVRHLEIFADARDWRDVR